LIKTHYIIDINYLNIQKYCFLIILLLHMIRLIFFSAVQCIFSKFSRSISIGLGRSLIFVGGFSLTTCNCTVLFSFCSFSYTFLIVCFFFLSRDCPCICNLFSNLFRLFCILSFLYILRYPSIVRALKTLPKPCFLTNSAKFLNDIFTIILF
jgi:hypothetical protein